MRVRQTLGPVFGTVALLAFLFVAVFPTRTWLEQRDEIAAERQRLAVLTRENGRLAARVQELHTDAEIERIAREQYNLVKPGERAYAILPGPADPQPDPEPVPTEPPRPPDRSLWSRIGDAITFWS